MNRRLFIQALSRSPVVAAIAGKAITERAAIDLAGISTGFTGSNGDHPQGSAGGLKGESNIGDSEPSPQQWKLLLQNKLVRTQVESIFYEDYRIIRRIDPDLAVLRSLSLNAKVTFQRQRIVARQLEQIGEPYRSAWFQVRQLAQKYLKLMLLG